MLIFDKDVAPFTPYYSYSLRIVASYDCHFFPILHLLRVLIGYCIFSDGPKSVVLLPSTPTYTVTETTGGIGPINCTADCRPNCTMTWSGPNLPGDTNSILNLQNMSRKQAGDYRCTATNSVGNLTSQKVAVTINCKQLVSVGELSKYTCFNFVKKSFIYEFANLRSLINGIRSPSLIYIATPPALSSML